MFGMIGYISTYYINPASHWWGSVLADWGLGYSWILAVATGLGIIIHRSKLRYNRILENQEILLIVFLGLIWFSILVGLVFNQAGSNAIKITKVTFILLMASHLITDLKRYQIVIWTLIITGTYLAYETYVAPGWMFNGGRFHAGVGGSDFAEGNFLAAHFGMLVPFIGVMFLNGGWKSKAICLTSGALIVNAIILCRSRGTFLALGLGAIAALVFSAPARRSKIAAMLAIGIIGAIILADPFFWARMDTIKADISQRDTSAQGRIFVWKAALSMVSEHPLGVGEGNFKNAIFQYNPDASGRDTHNTFLRCLAELGIQGAIIFILLIINAFYMLFSIQKDIQTLPNKEDLAWHIYALKLALIIYLSTGMFITQTYIEELYWLLMFPLFLKRSVENEVHTAQKQTI
jgi:O-antigen ligase